MNGIQKVSGSIPLISTTHLIHHICSMWFFLFTLLTAISDSLDSMRHFIPLESVPYLTGSIPLISTTYLIHHICPMWFFLFIPLTAVSDSLDFMRHFVPLKSVPYLTGSISIIYITIKKSTLLRCALFCIDAKKEQYLIYMMVLFLFVLPGIVQKNYFRNASSRTGCMSGRGSA